MSLTVQQLAWDSNFFGFGVARLTGEATTLAEAATALAECQATGIRLVYWYTQPDDRVANQTARQCGARLADRKVTFAMALPPTSAIALADTDIATTTVFTPQLESLAWQSGEYSRFALDKRLPVTAFQQLYTQWLQNSLNGSIARAVLTMLDPAGYEVGLLTLGEKNNRADIGLLAVDEKARGQRIGKRLVAEARRLAATAGYTELQVVTQRDNDRACRFYEYCGFSIAHEEYIYHLWLE